MRSFIFKSFFSCLFFLATYAIPLSAQAPFSLVPLGFSVASYQFALDDFGNAIVVYNLYNTSNGVGPGNSVLQVAFLPNGGDWLFGPNQATVPGDPRFQENIISPLGFNVASYQLAVDNQGNALVLWLVNNGTSSVRGTNVVQFSFMPFGGAFSIALTPQIQSNIISPLTFNVLDFQSAIDANGNTAVTWRIANGVNTVVQAVFKPVNGAFTSPQPPNSQLNVLSPLGFNVAVAPQVAIDAGNVAVAWQINNNALPPLTTPNPNNVVQASVMPAGGTFTQTGDPRFQTNVLSPVNLNVITPPQVDVFSGTGAIPGTVVVLWETQSNGAAILQSAFTSLPTVNFQKPPNFPP